MARPRKPHGIKTGQYRSQLEARTALQLGGAVLAYEGEQIPYSLKHSYTPDFTLKNNIRLEVKGWWLSSDRTKHLAIQAQHPGLDIRFVFQNPHARLSSKSKTTYAQWCDKHGFKWSGPQVPAAWLKVNNTHVP